MSCLIVRAMLAHRLQDSVNRIRFVPGRRERRPLVPSHAQFVRNTFRSQSHGIWAEATSIAAGPLSNRECELRFDPAPIKAGPCRDTR